MSSLYKKLIMMGVSTILIPLGKVIITKIVEKGADKLTSKSDDDEKDEPTRRRKKAVPEAS
jgi:hypothetical protein